MRKAFIACLLLLGTCGCATESPSSTIVSPTTTDDRSWKWVIGMDMLESAANYPPMPDSLKVLLPPKASANGQWQQIAVLQVPPNSHFALIMHRTERSNGKDPQGYFSDQTVVGLAWHQLSQAGYFKELAFLRADGTSIQTQMARIGQDWMVQTQTEEGDLWVTDSTLLQFLGF